MGGGYSLGLGFCLYGLSYGLGCGLGYGLTLFGTTIASGVNCGIGAIGLMGGRYTGAPIGNLNLGGVVRSLADQL